MFVGSLGPETVAFDDFGTNAADRRLGSSMLAEYRCMRRFPGAWAARVANDELRDLFRSFDGISKCCAFDWPLKGRSLESYHLRKA